MWVLRVRRPHSHKTDNSRPNEVIGTNNVTYTGVPDRVNPELRKLIGVFATFQSAFLQQGATLSR